VSPKKVSLGLDHEAALAREVAAAAGVEAEHAHDARHHAEILRSAVNASA
jgi:hypothetical protein